MLQQILNDMFIDPELLAELSEEQKQILFVKMREEQVRRYHAKELDLENKDRNSAKNFSQERKKCKVNFLNGVDGKEWVWVMGEHKDDLSIAEILEKETKQKALKQAEKEAEELRKKEEEAPVSHKTDQSKTNISQNLSKFDSKIIPEPLDKRKPVFIQKNADISLSNQATNPTARLRRRKDQVNRDIIDRRSREIVESFRELRARFEQKAFEEKDQIENSWLQAEQRAKKEEEARRQRARQAREEYRKSLLFEPDEGDIAGLEKLCVKSEIKPTPSKKNLSDRPPVSQRPAYLPTISQVVVSNIRATRPKNRQEVIDWFKAREKPRRAHIDPISGNIPVWFHGAISRENAEKLLESKESHSFLVRVSEKIFGYAVSYQDGSDDVIKHFMIEVLPDTEKYRFFGTTNQSFNSLSAMITFYKTNPVSVNEEYLIHPVGQTDHPPDYSLLVHHISEDDFSTNL